MKILFYVWQKKLHKNNFLNLLVFIHLATYWLNVCRCTCLIMYIWKEWMFQKPYKASLSLQLTANLISYDVVVFHLISYEYIDPFHIKRESPIPLITFVYNRQGWVNLVISLPPSFSPSSCLHNFIF